MLWYDMVLYVMVWYGTVLYGIVDHIFTPSPPETHDQTAIAIAASLSQTIKQSQKIARQAIRAIIPLYFRMFPANAQTGK